MSSRRKIMVEGEEVSQPVEKEEIVTEDNPQKRTLLCVGDGGKQFQVTIPAKAKVTFSPWSPANERNRDYGSNRGTLRVYATSAPNASIIFIKSGVTEFRDLDAVEYEEATDEVIGKRVWKNDKFGHVLHEEVRRAPNSWETTPLDRQLPGVDDPEEL